MTENKRFIRLSATRIRDTKTGENYICYITLFNEITKICDENEQLKETIKELELENAKHIGDGEWDIRDITYGHGKFRLEEWGERYHQFYNGDKPLEDEEVVSLLFENEQLKKQREELFIRERDTKNNWRELKYENKELKQFKQTVQNTLNQYSQKNLNQNEKIILTEIAKKLNMNLHYKKQPEKETEKKGKCGYCKHFQLDGMFGTWCDINDTDYLHNNDNNCPNYER